WVAPPGGPSCCFASPPPSFPTACSAWSPPSSLPPPRRLDGAAPRGGAAERPDEMIHREGVQREGGEAQVDGHRHLEDLDGREDRHPDVPPLADGPVVPELPEHAADEAGQEPSVDEAPIPARPGGQERRAARPVVQRIEQGH